MMKIAILGAGKVGTTLGRGLAAHGHSILYALRNPDDPKHEALRAEASAVGLPADMVAAAELVILATPWAATEAALEAAGDFGGKPLLDATNPIGPGMRLTHGHDDSGGEQVQRWARNARVVKVFNTTGRENMAEPRYPDGRVAMLLCGDDDEACAIAKGLCEDIGFDPVRVGALAEARLLEPAALVWIKLSIRGELGRGFGFGLLRRA